MRLVASESIVELRDQFEGLLRLRAPQWPSEELFTVDQAGLWSALAEWALVGVPQRAGGAGADLRDLLEFAEAWGRYLLPAPFIPTLLVGRWAGPASLDGGAVWTIAAPRQAGGSVVPFADWPGIAVFAGGGLQDGPAQFEPTDRFAPSLPLAESVAPAAMTPTQARELRAMCAAEAVGVASRVLERSVEYSAQRQAFGRAIVAFQAIRHMLADMHRDVEIARSAAVWAANVDEGDNHAAVRECLRLCLHVTALGVQVFGGMGFTWELGVHFQQRHVLALAQLADVEGTASPVTH
jgi:alkylation response protein AidB-like acyl-CoA dehydrogenase